MTGALFPFWKRWIFWANAAARAHLDKRSFWKRWLIRYLEKLGGGDRILHLNIHGFSMRVYPHTGDPQRHVHLCCVKQF